MATKRNVRLPAFIVSGVAIVLLFGVGGYLLEPNLSMLAPAVATPSPTQTQTQTPQPTASAEPVRQAMPSSCESLYSPELTEELSRSSSLHDGAWTGAESYPREPFMTDLITDETLSCYWEDAGSDFFETAITPLSVEESAELVTSLSGAGYTCFPVDEGSLCVDERQASDEPTWVDTHFIRDGLWAQSRVDGYGLTQAVVGEGMSALIIEAIFPTP